MGEEPRLAIAQKMSHKLLLFETSLRLLSCCRVCVLRGVLLPSVFDGGGEVFDARGSVTKPSCSLPVQPGQTAQQLMWT